MSKKNPTIAFLLAIIVGPFGMLYWGIRTGIAAILAEAAFILIITILNYEIGLWYYILSRIVYLVTTARLLGMSPKEIEDVTQVNFLGFIYLVGMLLVNYLFFGFIGFVLWSLFT